MIRRSACAPTRTSFTPGRSGSTTPVHFMTASPPSRPSVPTAATRWVTRRSHCCAQRRASRGRASRASSRPANCCTITVDCSPRGEPTSVVKAPTIVRTLAALCALSLGAVSAAGEPAQPQASAVSIGESIYRFGALPGGEPLRGERASGVPVEGSDAACVNCHRRSGLGASEGRGFIPPITGQFLFHQQSGDREDRNLPYVEGARPYREPYTDESLARAIRDGIGVD